MAFVKILYYFIFKHSSFWPSDDVKPVVRKLYLPELSLIQLSKLSNRLTVRNTDKTISQNIYANWSQMPTIWYPHRCVSLLTLLWMLIDAIVGFDQRTHTCLLSFCLSITLLSFPFFPFHIKTLSPIILASIEIQISPYSLVLISKVTSIRNCLKLTHIPQCYFI
jgi:hypothetical protein